MLNLITTLIISLELFSTFSAVKSETPIISSGIPSQITFAVKDDETKSLKGSDLTPDCKFPWSVNWSVQKNSTSGSRLVIEINNGTLSFKVIPALGMAIQDVVIGKQIPGWNSPVTGSTPASSVEVIIDRTPPCRITIRGIVEEAVSNGSKLQTIKEIFTVPGASTFQMSNTIDFAALENKTSVSTKPTIKLAEVIKSAQTWEPSFKEWFGKPAPDFTITDITGKQHKVSDYRGKNLIINVWATWCPPCKREIPDFIELRKTTSENELAILGISTEDGQESKVKQFVSQNKMNYTILVADPLKLAAPYSKISAIPTTFFIDPEGKIKIATIGVLTLKDTKDILQAQ